MDVDAAPFAADPACARVLVTARAVDELAGRERRETTSQSTAAWGEPAVVLRCGVAPPGPTTDPCLAVGGVDWVVRETERGTSYTTYGRRPAVEVVVPSGVGASDVVLTDLGALVAFLPQTRECL